MSSPAATSSTTPHPTPATAAERPASGGHAKGLGKHDAHPGPRSTAHLSLVLLAPARLLLFVPRRTLGELFEGGDWGEA